MGTENDVPGVDQQAAPSVPPRHRAKKILKNSGFLYFRMLLVLVVSLYTARIVLRELGVVDYGIYNVVAGFVALVGFLSAALSQTTQRFIAFEMARPSGSVGTVFCTSITIHVALSGIVLIAGHFAGQWAIDSLLNFPPERVQAVRGAFYFSLLAFGISVVQVPFHSLVVAQERMHVFAGISIFEVVSKLLIALSIQFAWADRLVHFTGLLSCLSVLVLIAYFLACTEVLRIAKGQPKWSGSVATSLIDQVGWNLWGNIAAILGGHGVNLLLNVFFGPVINAAKGIAAQVQSAVAMFITNIQTAVNPQITKTYAVDDRSAFERLVLGGAKLYSFIYLLTAVPVIFEASYLLELWLGGPPPHSVMFTRIVIVTLFANAVSGTLFTAAQASGRVRAYNAILGTVSLCNVPISWLVLRSGAGPEAALYVGLVLALLMVPIRIVLVGRIASIAPMAFLRKVLGPVAAVSILVILAALIPVNLMEESFLRLVVTASVVGVAVLATAAVIGLDQIEKAMVVAGMKGIKGRFVSYWSKSRRSASL